MECQELVWIHLYAQFSVECYVGGCYYNNYVYFTNCIQ
jgi:hypothetical protein